MTDKTERIAKVIARAGLCSRRDAERWIAEGRVALNGAVVTEPGTTVDGEDRITVDGAPLPKPEKIRVWRLHKPVGVIVSERDEEGRTLLKDILPPTMPRVIPIGRLDINSEGLILLTNDGAFKRRLELPESGFERSYRVRAYGRASQSKLDRLQHGVTIDGVRYGAITAEIESQNGANVWMQFTLTEGKNREIRKVCEHLGLKVNRLIRTGYGGLSLGSLPRRACIEVSGKQLWDTFEVGVQPKKSWAKAKPKRKRLSQSSKAKDAKNEKLGEEKRGGQNNRRGAARAQAQRAASRASSKAARSEPSATD